jgi:hypothetical protein
VRSSTAERAEGSGLRAPGWQPMHTNTTVIGNSIAASLFMTAAYRFPLDRQRDRPCVLVGNCVIERRGTTAPLPVQALMPPAGRGGTPRPGRGVALCRQRGRARRPAAQKKRGDVNRQNQYRISIEELLRKEQRTLLDIARGTISEGRLVPALCRFRCYVNLEGTCEHGCPSVLKALMIRGFGWSEIPGNQA